MRITPKRLRRTHEIMSIRDAVRFAVGLEKTGDFCIKVQSRKITLRGRTTDLRCFVKIFVDREYASPFSIEPKFIVDAGANTGLSSLYFASVYPEAKIMAIEPEADNFRVLRKNCAGMEKITTLHGAIWSSCGTIALTESPGRVALGYTVGRDDLKTLGMVRTYSIPAMMRLAGASHIDILKMDIEGAEKELFSHNTDWLDHVSIIAIELHDQHHDSSGAFYRSLERKRFEETSRGENIFVKVEN